MKLNCYHLEQLRLEMNENRINDLSEVDNIGILGLDNYSGLVVLINSTGESVFVQHFCGELRSDIFEFKVVYEEIEDELVSGFYYKGDFYGLDEFIKKEVI